MRQLVLLLLFAFPWSHALAQDVFVPPRPIGVKGDTPIGEGPVTEPRAQAWIEATSPNFRIISSSGERQTREVARRLETFASALANVDPRLSPRGERTTVFVFSSRRDARPWFDLVLGRANSRSPGVYVGGSGAGTMLLDGSTAGWIVNRTIHHELVHDLLSRNGLQLPLWLQEGLAEYFSTATVTNDVVRVGAVNRGHIRRLVLAKRLKLETVFAAKHAIQVSESPTFYAASWAIVDWLIRRDAEAFSRFLTEVDRGVDAQEAIRKTYGVEIVVIDRAIRSGAITDRPGRRVEARGDIEIAAAPMTRDDAIVELAAFLGTLDSKRDEARAMLRRVIERTAETPRALVALARLESRDKKFLEAESLLQRAIDASPNEPEVRLALSAVLLRDALGVFAGLVETGSEDAARFGRARSLAMEAARLGAAEADVDALVGTSHLVVGKPDEGIEPLRRATTSRPLRDDLLVNLYALLLRSGRDAEAEDLFETRLRHRSSQTIAAARTILLRTRVEQVNDRLHRADTEGALAMLKSLRDQTPDDEGKAFLDQQLASLQRVAEVNRHITMYNEAIAAVNRGEKDRARRLVDELLEVASDEAVVRDAKKLREELRGR